MSNNRENCKFIEYYFSFILKKKIILHYLSRVVQVLKERTSAKEWEQNWGFLKNKKKRLEEEALKQGN